jgi:SecD/SecF fusion protein
MNPMFNSLFLLAFQDPASPSVSAPANSSGMAGWLVFLIVLAMLVLPFVIGQFLANALRLKDLGLKMGIILFALTLGLAPFVSRVAAGDSWKDALRWGIDLAGGTNMVFTVDYSRIDPSKVAGGNKVDAETMDRLVAAVTKRVNKGGVEEVTVRRVGADRVEVIVPGADPEQAERIKKQITQLGSLEFALLANEIEHERLIQEALALPDSVNELKHGDALVAKWRRVAMDPRTKEPKTVGTEFNVRTRDVTRDGKPVRQFLVVVDPDRKNWITGEYLRRATEEVDANGRPCVGFQFNTEGGYLFGRLTAAHLPQEASGFKTRLAILLNDEIHSAPSINDMISDRGIIQGDFDSAEINELINVLNAGALEVPLVEKPISEYTVSPLLGIDVQERGFSAIILATITVFVVTVGYYLLAGAVADLCLAINIILLMGSMSLINATFTLPGLAGVALAIGMAVDANVLIFERMREEQEKGSSLRMSIHNGFAKALSAIIDSNVTTLISAIVLYVLGTEQVKGFAVTLFLGLVWNMFCAVYVARMVFDIVERKRWLKRIKMFSLIRAENVDFVGKTRLVLGASLALIVLGLGALAMRGRDNMDIEFRGGSMLTFTFDEHAEPTVDEVRAALATQFKSSVSLERLTVDEPSGRQSILFRMRTAERDVEVVSQQLIAAFAEPPHNKFKLVQQHLQFGEIAAIPPSAGTPAGDTPRVDPFAGGNQVKVDMSKAVRAGTLAAAIMGKLEETTDTGGTQRYPDLQEQGALQVQPVSGAETDKSAQFTIKTRALVAASDLNDALARLQQQYEREPAFEEKTTFDSAVATDAQITALTAILLSNLAIVFYLWFRFQHVEFGVAAVVAVLFDVITVLGLVALGSYASGTFFGRLLALTDFKIDLSMVAAFMTIVGYSLNDKIVVFDRIREVRGKNPALTNALVNRCVNETLSRTMLTASTTLMVLLILYFRGGEGLHGFAYCMFLGIVIGTYSSIYVASPTLVWLTNRGKTATGAQLKAA